MGVESQISILAANFTSLLVLLSSADFFQDKLSNGLDPDRD